MKKRYLIILLLTMILMPFKVFAAGGFGVSTTSISMYPGESRIIAISTNNAVGKLNISSSNGGVASASPGSIFIQNPGSSGSITITGNSVGKATISVVASADFATMDEEILAGQKKVITVNVIAKPTTTTTTTTKTQVKTTTNNSKTTTTKDNKTTTATKKETSENNNLKEIIVEDHKLQKIDNNNYSLTVSNNISKITLKVEAEDTKAKVKGNGAYSLNIGENNIEIVITSETGKENKINIKVTRKDGYYLEDIDSILKDKNIKDINFIINENSKLSKEDISKIKKSKKEVRLNYYDKNKKLIYSWIIDGKQIKDENEFVTAITKTSENIEEIYKLSNYADGLYVNFKHSGKLPSKTKVKLYVGDKFKNGSMVNVYYHNVNKQSLDFIHSNVKVEDGYIEFVLEHCSDYFVTMSNLKGCKNLKQDKNSFNIFIIVSIVEFIALVIIGILYFKIKKNNSKKEIVESIDF